MRLRCCDDLPPCCFPQMKHVEERFGPEANKEVLLLCIGITSCIGRFVFGRVADYIPGVNKVYLQVNITGLQLYWSVWSVATQSGSSLQTHQDQRDPPAGGGGGRQEQGHMSANDWLEPAVNKLLQIRWRLILHLICRMLQL